MRTGSPRPLSVLAGGGLKKEPADKAGVHPQAVSEWLKQPHFREALDLLRVELLEHAMEEVRNTLVKSNRNAFVDGGR
jgi:hypothetical protein